MKFYPLVIAFILFSCGSPEDSEKHFDFESDMTLGDARIMDALIAHGWYERDNANFTFDFRDRSYSFEYEGSDYTYTRTLEADTILIEDEMTNNSFERKIDGEVVELPKEESEKYRESINSVIYFATLPHKLGDESVNKELEYKHIINEIHYDVVTVTFDEEGGGKDHQDEYMYWINPESKHIDFFAYNYQVNGGGARFRVAYNKREIGGITFQDYENYEAPFETPLLDLPDLYLSDSLKLLSLIETENIVDLSK